MITAKEYWSYTNGRLAAQVCWHCKERIDFSGPYYCIQKIRDKKHQTPVRGERSTLDLLFHSYCFSVVAGQKYQFEKEEDEQ